MAINNIVDESFIINQKKLKQFGDRCSNVKIGIMGGTFDPIHYAHLATAEFIRDNYKLDKILFIPSGNPPHKKGNITDKYDRYNMVLLSTVNNDDFIVSDIEIKREKSTYTIDTLKVLKQIYKNADDLISAAKELKRLKGGVRQGRVIGNIDEIFQSISQGGQRIGKNSFRLPDGTIITKYSSSTTGVPTIHINKQGQLFKIRVETGINIE